jgi:hypothetical protein
MGNGSCTLLRAVVTGGALCWERAEAGCVLENSEWSAGAISILASWLCGDAGAHSFADFGAEGGHAFHCDAGFEAARGAVSTGQATTAGRCAADAVVERSADGSVAEFLAAAVL